MKSEVRMRHTSSNETSPEKTSFLILQKAIEIKKSRRFNKSLLPLPDIQQHREGAAGGLHSVRCCHWVVMDVIAELDPGAPAPGKRPKRRQ